MAKKIEAGCALDWLVDQMAYKPKQPGEFTVKEAMIKAKARGFSGTESATRNHLHYLKAKGELESRQIPIAGSMTTLWRKVGK